jgi:3-methyladenine DNA glycosylase AlkC
MHHMVGIWFIYQSVMNGNTHVTDMCAECYKVILPKVKALLKEHNIVGQL